MIGTTHLAYEKSKPNMGYRYGHLQRLGLYKYSLTEKDQHARREHAKELLSEGEGRAISLREKVKKKRRGRPQEAPKYDLAYNLLHTIEPCFHIKH